MSAAQIGKVIANRELSFARDDGTSETVLVSIHEPLQDNRGRWRCVYTIKGQTFDRWFDAGGVDSAQALLLVQYMINTELDTFAIQMRGRFLFDGHPDHGFPRMPETKKDA